MTVAGRVVRRIAAVLAAGYAAALLILAFAFPLVGERWWITGVLLYLPRVLWAAPLPLSAGAVLVARLRGLWWTQLAAGLLLLFPIMGLVLPRPSGQRPAPTLRVLSYNVNSSYGGAENVTREIDLHSPDVALLQEAWSAGGIVDILRARYPVVEVTNQFILATRLRVLSSTDPDKLEYHGQQRSARYVQYVLETPLGRIAVYNVHPISPRQAFYTIRGQGLSREIPSGRVFSDANGATFLDNAGLREAQVRAFAAAARSETDPVIIAGDTNLPTLSFVLHEYLSGYQDGFTKAGWGFGYTFPANRRPWMRLDRIMASEQLRFVRFEVGASRASDHLCVVADLQRREP
ncbi:MAG TPA: endonuclease/exonuclease/phosphatase family protein [Polyangiaceae bacterium]|nr:endonuclease/exonuclease/phosphatase family protein [Polyangiaceae bacterium]